MNTNLRYAVAAALLSLPVAALAQGRGGGGGGPPAGVGGPPAGVGHGPSAGSMGGMHGDASGRLNGRPIEFASKGELHRAELAARKAAAEEKKAAAEQKKAEAEAKRAAAQARREEAAAQGAAHANENATFGQDVAADARTLKDADVDTRREFGKGVSTQAKANADARGVDEDDEEADGSRVANSDFGKSTAEGARLQKDADVEERTQFGASVKTRAADKAEAAPAARKRKGG